MEPPNGSSETMPWYKVETSVNQVGNLKEEFMKILLFVSKPKRYDMVLFGDGFSHDDYFNVYFTPVCASHPAMKGLIDSWGAVPCDEPTRETERELGKLVDIDSERWREYIWHPDYCP